jgi:hypothetical protein
MIREMIKASCKNELTVLDVPLEKKYQYTVVEMASSLRNTTIIQLFRMFV